MDRETSDLIARWYLGTTSAREFPDWAVNELEKGRDSENLRILGSQIGAKRHDEVEDYFRKAVADLEWHLPDKVEAANAYATRLMQDIVDRAILPNEACKELHMICRSLAYPANLYNWSALYWEGDELSDKEFGDLVLNEARQVLNGDRPELIYPGYLSNTKRDPSPSFWNRLKSFFYK